MKHPTRALAASLCLAAACKTQVEEPVVASLHWPQGETLRVTRDLSLPTGTWLRPPLGADGRAGVLRLEGVSGVTLDLTGVRLRGAPAGSDPDQRSGWGILVRGCRDVTLRGGDLAGYKACIVVEDSTGVTIEDMRFDGWYAQRLASTPAAEDGADWLSPHENDDGQWVTQYGAAISASDCRGLVVRRCRGRHGQNGILLTRVTGSEVYDNDFCFMSGWGLAMYRSSRNVVSHNWFDYCVRGYSHGVYSRGQDSAGIVMFERCCENVVAFNSATHSGDGIFLYAGQDLVQGRARARGEGDPGGGDRNLFYGNDLRHSPANAIETTFSNRNVAIANDLSGCAQHGVWGGYSSEMLILDNTIDDTAGGGVTIEHGQDNVVARNTFRRNNMGVELYWDPDPHLVDSPLGEQRDTSSRDTWILSNVFEDNTQDVVLKQTTGAVLFDNDWIGDGRRPYIDQLSAAGEPVAAETLTGWLADRDGELPSGHFSQSTLREWPGRYPALLEEHGRVEPPRVPGSLAVRGELRGLVVGDRSTIVMGEWGPWDHRSGDPRPSQRRPGGLLEGARWETRWFRWSLAQSDPRKDLVAWRALADDALVFKRVPNFTDPWSDGDVRAAVGNDHFGLIATTSLEVAGGRHSLSVTSDDGVRVLVDGGEVFSDWTYHSERHGGASLYLSPGRHELRLEYFQAVGAAVLTLELEREE